jgi:excisionase family DNA binding protein
MGDELVTVTQAAALLGVSRGMIHHLIRRGILTPLRLPPQGRTKGHKIYLRLQEVEAARGKWQPRNRG